MPLSAEILERHLGIRPTSATEATLRMLIWTGLQLTGAQEGSLLVLDRVNNELRFAMTVGNEESESTLLDQPVPLGKGISGLAAASREVQIGAPTYRDVKQSQKVGHDPEAVIAAPMLAGDELLGVLTCVSFEPGKRFGTDQGRLYGGFAVIAGVVVDQERRLARLETGAMAAPADPREQRIVEIAARIGRARSDALSDALAVLERIEHLALAPVPPRAA